MCLQRNFEERRRQVLPQLMRKNAGGSCLEIVQGGVILEDNWLADEPINVQNTKICLGKGGSRVLKRNCFSSLSLCPSTSVKG